ncbi:MAG: hypothetical protein ABFD90_01180 [Phycisphaerales bacterium]
MNRDMRIHPVRAASVRGLVLLGLLVAAPASLCYAQPGQVVGWGNSLGGRYNPQPSDECMAISAGGYHSLALTASGRLMAWGENSNGQCNIPYGNSFVAIASGLYHNLALKADGTVVAWGDNSRGQCNVPRNTKFREIAAGRWHSLGIRLDGSLVAWGWNEQGQCDVPEGRDYTSLCGGYSHSMALKIDGSIVAWGSNGDGQSSVPQGTSFIQIAAGTLHSLALKADGTLVAWGRNGEGQCRVPSGNDFVAVAAGSLHNLALRRDGHIEAWGQNNYAQCDVPEGGQFAVIAAGDFHSLAIRDARKQFLPAKSVEPQVTPVKTPAGPKTTRTPVQTDIEPAVGPGQTPLVLPEVIQDSNAMATDTLLSKLEQRESIPIRELDPATIQKLREKDPNATPAGPTPTEQVKTAAPIPAAAATKEKTPAEAVKPPAAAAAEPNKPAIDLESPANQGYAPSIYMGVIENASPVYHFISTKTKRHFCTISEEEKYKLLDQKPPAWKYQGIAFFAYAEGHQPKEARPVYRFRSESLGQYFYTMDEATKEMMVKDLPNEWKFEGIAWYAPPIKQPGSHIHK